MANFINISFEKDTTESDSLVMDRDFFNGIGDAFFIADPITGQILDCNIQAEAMTGYTRTEILDLSADLLHPPELRELTMEAFSRHASGKRFLIESKVITKTGDLIPVEINSTLAMVREKKVLIGCFRDITKRRLTEQKLQLSERRYRELYESSRDGYVIVNTEGKFVRFNTAFVTMLGYSEEELLTLSNKDITPKQWWAAEQSVIQHQVMKRGYSELYEKEYICKDDTIIPVDLRTYLVCDENGNPEAMWAFIRDISEQKRIEQQLKSSLREKEVLLKEIHHRVKNNLQVISSLLNLQLRHIQDVKAQEMLRESKNRIQSMSLIHETLYQDSNIFSVEFGYYLKSIIHHLFRSYGIEDDRIVLEIDTNDVSLVLNQAIPCSLIVNELVSNSLKYAFPENGSGVITIRMKPLSDQIELLVKDNGRGFADGCDIGKSDTMGLTIIRLLIHDQLKGNIEYNGTNGAQFIIRFPRKSS